MEIKAGDVVVRTGGSGGSNSLPYKTGDMMEVRSVMPNSHINLIRKEGECNGSNPNDFRKATELELSYYLKGVINIKHIPKEPSYSIY